MRLTLFCAMAGLLAACTGPARTPLPDAAPKTASEARPAQPQNRPAEKPEAAQPAETPRAAQPDDKPADVKRGKLEDPDEPEQKRALEIIERVTGLKFKKAIPVYVYTPEDLAAEMKEWGGDFVPENILGFYKPSTKAFYLVPKAAGNKRSFGLRVHEATHALQDQHFDLILLHQSVKTTDQDHALTAVIEGHAVQVMIDGLSDLSPHVARIADVTVPTDKHNPAAWHTVFYYAMGAKFVQALKARGGYADVHKAFGSLPASSEQILHPEKYTTEPDWPDRIELDIEAVKAAAPKGFELKGEDTLGEWTTRMLFTAEPATFDAAEALARGWGGDAEVTLATSGRDAKVVKLWVTSWDSEEEAAEFHTALAKLPDVRASARDKRLVTLVRSSETLDASIAEALMQAGGKARITLDPAK